MTLYLGRSPGTSVGVTVSRRVRRHSCPLADAARRLAQAARESAAAVRLELASTVRTIAPDADGVLFYEERDGALYCSSALGERFAYFPGSVIGLDDTRALPACALAAAHHVTLTGSNARPLHPGDVAAVAVPLDLGAGRRCVLVVTARSELGPATVDRLAELAEQAAPTYALALDREHDRRDAEYDGLTGLLTPRAFRRRLTGLIERARFAAVPAFALVFVDTDHFKRWNDRYGHAAGDALLRELAAVLRSAALSSSDFVARNGGDEFCIVFGDAPKAHAIERAEALRREIAALDGSLLRASARAPAPDDRRAPAPHHMAISASIGVAAYPSDGASANDLLERADAAMYHSKETGRDGVSYVDPSGELVRSAASPHAPRA